MSTETRIDDLVAAMGGFAHYAAARAWALGAAKADASYLITPNARRRAMAILAEDDSVKAQAARVILNDGGAQRGELASNGRPYTMARLEEWRNAADVLGVFGGDDE